MSNRSGLISNVLWKFAERIAAQIITLAVSVILARLLLPEQYGVISMVTVFITVANVFVTEGIPSALIQKKDADDLDFSSVFYFNLIVSICIYIILFLSAPIIAIFYKDSVFCPIVRVMGLRIVIASINSVQHAYVSRHMLFKKYFWSTLFGTLLSGIIGIAMAYMGFGIWALVSQYMINTIVDTIVLYVTVKWRPIRYFNFGKVKELLSFGWKMLFEAVSNTIAGQLQNLIIGRAYTSSDLAYYTKGQQFPALIVTNITTSVGSVLFPTMANEQGNKGHVLDMLRKSIRISSYVVYPMLTGLAVVANPFIRLILTDKWLQAVPYLQVFCLLNMPTVGMIPRHQALNGTGRSDVFMNEHILARIVAIILLLLTYRISILAILLGSIISAVILSLIIAYTSKRYNGYAYRDQVKDIFPTLAGCLIMGIPVYFIQYLGFSAMITLCLQVIAGMGIYILYSFLFKLEEFDICLKYLLTFIKKIKR